jgi:uncharacterized protein involved in response to NO
MSFDDLSNLKAILLVKLARYRYALKFLQMTRSVILYLVSLISGRVLKQLKNFELNESNLVMMFNIDQYFIFND